MAAYKPKRIGVESKYNVYEFVYQGKDFRAQPGLSPRLLPESTKNRGTPERERAAGLPSKKQGGVPKSTMLALMGHMSHAMIYRLLI